MLRLNYVGLSLPWEDTLVNVRYRLSRCHKPIEMVSDFLVSLILRKPLPTDKIFCEKLP